MGLGPATPQLLLTNYPIFPRDALGVVLHKDSKWYQQWKDFRDNNVVFNRECSCHQHVADSKAVTGHLLSTPQAWHSRPPLYRGGDWIREDHLFLQGYSVSEQWGTGLEVANGQGHGH